MSRIKRREAEAIAAKLGAEVKAKAKHDTVLVRHDNIIIASYGMRRDKSAGYPYLPSQLFISETEALRLARCPMSKEEYFARLKEKGKI